MRRVGLLVVASMCVLVGSSPATAAPPPAAGVFSAPGVACIGSTTLATGCPAQSPALQAALDVAVSDDGQTVYALTRYAGGAVVAVRRQPDGSLGSVLDCVAAQPSATCAKVVPSLLNGVALRIGAASQLLIGSEYGMSGAVTAIATAPDGTIGSLLNCVATAATGSAAGCTARQGLYLVQDVAVSPGGTIYVASFSGYTTGTVLALSTTAGGAIGDVLSCWHTTGSSPSYQCPSSATNRIASPTGLAVGPDGTVYVASSEYQASYGVVTAFPVAPGGAMQAPGNCVSDPGATEPAQACGATAPGLLGAHDLAVSPDSRLYVGASPLDGSKGSVAAFSLQASGNIGSQLNCLGSDVSTGCPAVAGLRGVSGLSIAPDGTVYAAANYSATDGAATALGRQQNGAFSGLINCIGVTSGTGCSLRANGLAGANAIAGSHDGTMQNLYVAGRYANAQSAPGSDGALVALTRELAPICTASTAATTAAQPVSVKLACADPNGDALTRTIPNGPAHGSLDAVDQAGGSVIYRPAVGFSGRDTFTVQAGDGTLSSGVATVSVDVAPATPATPGGPSTTPATPTRAKVTTFSMTRRSFAVSSKRTALTAAKVLTGTTFRYAVDRAGRVGIVIASCRRGTTKKTKRDLCAKQTTRGTLTRTAKAAGRFSLAFSGRLGTKPLVLGRYRATITLTPAAPNLVSRPRSIDFVVVRKPLRGN